MSIRRPVAVALTVAAVVFASSAVAGNASVFIARAKTATLPYIAKTGTGVLGRLDAASLQRPALQLTLPDGRTVIAYQRHVRRKGTQVTWVGTFRDAPNDLLIVTAANGVVAGSLTYAGKRFELRPQPTGEALLFEVDPTKLPAEQDRVLTPPSSSPAYGVARAKTLAAPTVAASTTPLVQDVVVMYTAGATADYGAGLSNAIISAIEQTNAAYRDGGIGITLNLVGIVPSNIVEGPGMTDTLQTFYQDTSAQAVRDQYGADLMLLINDNYDYCGIAYRMVYPNANFAPLAYGAVSSMCVNGIVVAHEIGHIQGLAHDRETTGSGATTAYPYAYGYRNCAGGARDIMSYSCTSGSAYVVNRFSDPRYLVNGVPFGYEYELYPAQAADAVRALNDTAAITAGFRASQALTPPAWPSDLALAMEGDSAVRLGWHDNSNDEAGFAVARSTDGLEWTEIARLAAGTTAYVDATVTRGATYSYRITAFNGAGWSEASNVASIVVQSPPPAPPANVTALNGRNLTATIAWTAVAGARSYDVQRESWAKVVTRYQTTSGKWKSRKSFQWTGLRAVGTVPAEVAVTIVDTSGVGRFRYRVRAVNLAGAGEWSLPVEVTVTKQ